MSYNPEIHHRHTIRLKGYDYSKEGLYFITFCVKDREYILGKIVEEYDDSLLRYQQKIMILNEAGEIARRCWMSISQHFPNVLLHEFVIMPNHVHGIIEIVENISHSGPTDIILNNDGRIDMDYAGAKNVKT